MFLKDSEDATTDIVFTNFELLLKKNKTFKIVLVGNFNNVRCMVIIFRSYIYLMNTYLKNDVDGAMNNFFGNFKLLLKENKNLQNYVRV